MKLDSEWVETPDRMYESVDRWIGLVLRLEGVEESIPNNQHATIVLVDIFWISAMMNAMMARSVENIFKWSDIIDNFRMNPSHIELA